MILSADLAALTVVRCSKDEQAICDARFGTGPELEWACKNCKKHRGEIKLHPYTRKLMNNRMLIMAGYPLRRNDLTVDEWVDLGRLNQWLATQAL